MFAQNLKGTTFCNKHVQGYILSRKKLPENLRICKNCSFNQVENEVHFLLHRDSYSCIRKTLLNDILSKYFIFNTLNDQDKILFLFNNVDHYICKKTGYLVWNLSRKGNGSQDIVTNY